MIKKLKIEAILDEIESEIKKIGFWNECPPRFDVQNYTESPSFELWLQCIFLPNAREAAKNEIYPNSSQVGLMAMREYDYHSCVEKALNLVSLLHKFDNMVISE
jgi:uncharacterized protein YqcC (DUF446 family)